MAGQRAQQAASGQKIAVDLSGITLIDSNGKAVLMNMNGQGTKLVARRVHNEHIVEKLKSRARAPGAARIIGLRRKPWLSSQYLVDLFWWVE